MSDVITFTEAQWSLLLLKVSALCCSIYENNSMSELTQVKVEADSENVCNKEISKYVEIDKVLGNRFRFCVTLTGENVATELRVFCDTSQFICESPPHQLSSGNISFLLPNTIIKLSKCNRLLL